MTAMFGEMRPLASMILYLFVVIDILKSLLKTINLVLERENVDTLKNLALEGLAQLIEPLY